MSVIESCVARLRAHFADDDVVARVANISPAFVRSVHAGDANARTVNPEGSYFVQDLAVRTCRELRSASKAADVLGLPRQYIQNAVASRRPTGGWRERARAWLS
jgi:hypothetical protein